MLLIFRLSPLWKLLPSRNVTPYSNFFWLVISCAPVAKKIQNAVARVRSCYRAIASYSHKTRAALLHLSNRLENDVH